MVALTSKLGVSCLVVLCWSSDFSDTLDGEFQLSTDVANICPTITNVNLGLITINFQIQIRRKQHIEQVAARLSQPST